MDTDRFISSLNTKNIIEDFKNFEDLIDFGNLKENHELFSNKNKKVNRKFKTQTPKNFWIDEFMCLRSKMSSFKCGDDIKKLLKRFLKSQLTHNKFEGYKDA